MTVRASLDSRVVQDLERQQPESSTADALGHAVTSIYKPVQSQMADLELKLDGVIEDAPPDLAAMLAHALKGGGKGSGPHWFSLQEVCTLEDRNRSYRWRWDTSSCIPQRSFTTTL